MPNKKIPRMTLFFLAASRSLVVASCSSSGEPEIVPDSDSERPVVRPGIICQEVISPPTVLGDIEMGWPSENVK